MTDAHPTAPPVAGGKSRTGFQWLGVGLLVAASVVAVLGYLFLFTDMIVNDGEPDRTGVSPSGEWVYELHYLDYAGAAGSANWQIKVYPAGDPVAERIVYFDEGFPPRVHWSDESTLVVNGVSFDVRSDTLPVSASTLERIVTNAVRVLFIAVPTVPLAVAGAVILLSARRRRLRVGRAVLP